MLEEIQVEKKYKKRKSKGFHYSLRMKIENPLIGGWKVVIPKVNDL